MVVGGRSDSSSVASGLLKHALPLHCCTAARLLSKLEVLHSKLPEPIGSTGSNGSTGSALLDAHKGDRVLLEDRRPALAARLEGVEVWTHAPGGEDIGAAICKHRDTAALHTPGQAK